MMVRFQGVTVRYRGMRQPALSDVTLTVEKGEFAFVVGQTGVGKTTLLRLITREVKPTFGKVLVWGKDIARLKPSQVPLLRRKIGVVFQDFLLLPNKTAFENVAFALQVIGASPSDIRREVARALEVVGLREKASYFPNQLSGGEMQRLCIARAIVNNPLILLADEPTGNLDPDTSWDIVQLLAHINRRGTTVLIATHDKYIVDGMKRRVIELHDGRVVRDEPQGVYRSES